MANIKDVAKLSGLSVGTVSRVLNNRGYISEETRSRVEAAMKELNYVPNELAKSIFRRYTKIIGVIVPSVAQPYFGRIVESMEAFAAKLGYKIMLCNSYYEREKEMEYFQMLRSNKVDGIILGSRNLDISDAVSSRLPIVTIDRILSESIPCVAADNYQGGLLATQHLIDRGCRHLAHISGSPALHMMANLRSSAFADTCRKNSIEPLVISTEEAQFNALDYFDDIRRLLTEHPEVDGIFASSDIIAAEILHVAKELGRCVPQDLKIVGYDDIFLASLATPSITTIRQPIEQISKYALNFIIEEIEGNIVPLRTVLPVSLIAREST